MLKVARKAGHGSLFARRCVTFHVARIFSYKTYSKAKPLCYSQIKGTKRTSGGLERKEGPTVPCCIYSDLVLALLTDRIPEDQS